MAHLLFLSHRIPYPPEKGDKIRAWRILQHLAWRYELHLGCLHDAVEDAEHIPFLERLCVSVCCPRLVPWQAKLRCLPRLAGGDPLTLGYFANASLQHWVEATLRTYCPQAVFVFSSAMAAYVRHYHDGVRILDMVDVDSDKWRQYAATQSWPLSALYGREWRTLLAFERAIARDFDATLLVSEAETALFRSLAPESAARILTLPNGIDTEYFDPGHDYPDPYCGKGPVVVFTGAMDYWPNVQAVGWFSAEVMPILRGRFPDLQFFIVGINPAPAVRRLASEPGVTVTGRVADVRPYLKHASVVVAPLKIARGVQNKVLEAMAMGKPVVATPEACQGIAATPGSELETAASAVEFASRIESILAGQAPDLGLRARARIVRHYQWNFDLLDGIMEAPIHAPAAAG